MKTRTTTLALALTTAVGMASIAHADSNPFALSTLSQGYMVAADDKAKDGKCGEGKCGGTKTKDSNPQAKDGKAVDPKAKAKAKDGKCGEGKCGDGSY